jgi:hypothetical protein
VEEDLAREREKEQNKRQKQIELAKDFKKANQQLIEAQ